jgi:hypothetical protein
MANALTRSKAPLVRAAVCGIALCQWAAQPEPPSGIDATVAAYLKEHALEVKLSDGRLIGPAADWFRTEAAKAQFFFLGEEHDIREIPLIAGALWRVLVPLGYKHVAIEAGPWLGNRLDRFARFGDRQALAQFHAATWPRLPNNSVPPTSEEDIRFYELLGKVSGSHSASEAPLIWGLDAEYRTTPLLRRLAELSPAPVRRNSIELLLTRVEASEAIGDYNTASFRAEIKELIRERRAKSGTELFQILDALNWRIMEPAEREGRSVKKDLFLRQYHAAKRKGETAPRVMFRLGGYHATRGLMHDFGGPTLANSVAELANTERTRMLNVSFINCRATAPGEFPRPCTWEQERALKAFRAAAVGPWTLFDLRGLRPLIRRARLNALQAYPNGWEYWNLVMSLDAMVLLNNSKQSHLPAR